MYIKWQSVFSVVLSAIIKSSLQSIAGVTYMDHFDFEARYRDVNECNPFYWHPLHLPEQCQEMYEKLIRSQLSNGNTLRVMAEHMESSNLYSYYPQVYTVARMPGRKSTRTAYEQMLALIKNDIKYFPTPPKILSMPYLGPVAMYKQPISKQSELLIREMSRMYADAGLAYNPMPIIFKKEKDENGEKKKDTSDENSKANENDHTTKPALRHKHKNKIKVKRAKDGSTLTLIKRKY